MADAARVYALRVGASTKVVDQAVEYRLRAERRLGEILKQTPKDTGGRPTKTPTVVEGVLKPARLADLGVSFKVSANAQKLAAVPAAAFERRLAETKERGDGIDRKFVLTGVPHVAHNSGENEWYTPPEYIEAVRDVLGEIDLDPASTKEANSVVAAKRFFDKKADGLSREWGGSVFMNPPYAQPLITDFCRKFLEELSAGRVSRGIVLVNNATETEWFQGLANMAAAICFPRGRVRFWSHQRESAPLQGQAFIYFGGARERFRKVFKEFGLTVYSDV